MNRIEIEFFHDVICSFCFPMSYRMRQLKEMMPDVTIKHRSFALVRSDEDLIAMSGSVEAAKEEILRHWEHANQIDDLHRFQIEGMKKTTFKFPSSMNVLTACKAASFVAGEEGYWDVFDALQNALFVKNLNIEDENVIFQCVKETGLDFDKWKEHYYDPKCLEALEEDFALVDYYEINVVPTLIINKKYKLSGANPFNQLIDAINQIKNMPETKE